MPSAALPFRAALTCRNGPLPFRNVWKRLPLKAGGEKMKIDLLIPTREGELS